MDIDLGTVAIVIGGIALYFILRSYSTIKIKPPPREYLLEKPPARTSAPPARETSQEPARGRKDPAREQGLAGWEGTYGGERYTVRSYDGVNATVSIDVGGMLPVRAEITSPIESPSPSESPLAGDINALLYLGANYVDLGYHTNWVAADFPVSEVRVDRRLAERAVAHLVRLRDAAAGL